MALEFHYGLSIIYITKMTQEYSERMVLSVLQLEIGLLLELGVYLREAALQLSIQDQSIPSACLRDIAISLDARIDRLGTRIAGMKLPEGQGGRSQVGVFGRLTECLGPSEVLEQVRGAMLVVCQAFAAGIVEVGDLGDEGTAELLSQLSIELERDLWRLNSSVVTG